MISCPRLWIATNRLLGSNAFFDEECRKQRLGNVA
jgi:hypothetical protein